ncbi:aminoglycoside 6-adenylyltransferase [Anaerocolumna cellulosilytica]|uniref:Aminoglycoside 6-adenylyltransferase n=1 Tax=Anaerocolumna cellulosilytica TaxID=433286 RepID=A0A6S6R632_9FIRM|nr:aminoglycoside 6-adenylyltransferase [Anaerocolumna cellulosilytica]MBB5193874.1 aminoglycoside 6-adenylyltransferase [Anaerocolumna cellulosilytica]BCJ94910.1 aminoglycoside 6-adenylyltransferase [Anaerocolumna cellulosilytica]
MVQNIMFDLIMDIARSDTRIRAAAMTGSRIDPSATHDEFCDFDIVYLVRDIQSFVKDDNWLGVFGERLILQKPSDWYNHPYDYQGYKNFTYLLQLKDGCRIDLTLIDLKYVHDYIVNTEPRNILLDKDKILGLDSIEVGDYYFIKPPCPIKYKDICNEFWWTIPNVVKGLCRKQIMFVKHTMERFAVDMLLEVLYWNIGVENNFSVSAGKYGKYLEKYLDEETYHKFMFIFSGSSHEDIWQRLFIMCDLFQQEAKKVARHFEFYYDSKEAEEIIQYAKAMRQKYNQ